MVFSGQIGSSPLLLHGGEMIGRGSRRSLEETVAGLIPRLYRVAYYLSKDLHETEDAVQETLFRYVKALREGTREIRDPMGWCLRVLTRICSSRGGRAPLEVLAEDVPSQEAGPEALAQAVERRELVRRALRSLPEEEHQAICLHVFGGLTVREVASLLGMPRATTFDRIRKGLGLLRQNLPASCALALPPASAGEKGLLDWLGSLPSVSVPEKLAASVLDSASLCPGPAVGSAALAASIGGGITMPLTGKILIGAGAVLATISVGLGLRVLHLEGELRSAKAPTVRIAAEPSLAEIQALKDANAALRKEIEALRKAGPSGGEGAGEGERTAVVAGKAGETEIGVLLARALSALKTRDPDAFSEAFLALLDLGEAAHPALIRIFNQAEGFNGLFEALGMDDDRRGRFSDELKKREGRADRLVDAILSREEPPDRVTGFALEMLYHFRVKSGLSRDAHGACLLQILDRAGRAEEERLRGSAHLAAGLLGRLRFVEGLPVLEDLLLDEGASERDQAIYAQAIASVGGEESRASLRRVLAGMNERQQEHIILNLSNVEGAELDGFLEELLAGSESAGIRRMVLRAQSRRPGGLERLGGALQEGRLSRKESLQVLEGLLESGTPEAREKIWAIYETLDARAQEGVLGELARKDEKAAAILVERLASGAVSQELLNAYVSLDRRQVRLHEAEIRAAAARPSASTLTRGAAAAALYQIDAPGAVGALTAGFGDLGEGERLQIVGLLGSLLSGNEARGVLAEIAAGDPSEKVRTAAASTSRR
jgi:RNA polymerase sigma factor (sigma-70 family)